MSKRHWSDRLHGLNGMPSVSLPSASKTQRSFFLSLIALVGLLASGSGATANAQALLTASRAGDIQVGGGFSYGTSDYGPKIMGGTFYADFDFMKHVGLELGFHQLSDSQSQLYERTYEVGGRYLVRPRGELKPYVKGMYGRGVLNYPYNTGNIAYNMFVLGGGVDYGIKRWLTVRGDFEYQDWLSGPGIPNGLTPMVATVGVAYRFGSDKLNGRQWVIAAPRPERTPQGRPAGPPPPPVQDQPAPQAAPPSSL